MNEVKNCSLILEGGTFRTVYTAGVLDALMGEEIVMPYIAAISAGAINAVSYMSNQPQRTMRVLTTYRNDPRYMGARNFWKEKSIFGLDFSYNIVPNELDLSVLSQNTPFSRSIASRWEMNAILLLLYSLILRMYVWYNERNQHGQKGGVTHGSQSF